jgi:hypothetical protein
VIYVYAVGEHDAPVAERGLGGQPVEALRNGPLAAWLSRDAPRAIAPDPERLWRHEQVVRAIMQGGPVLPMRFGTLMPDDEALRAVLVARREEFARSLERVRGRVELGLRAQWKETPAKPPADSGHAFMHAKLECHTAARALAERLHDPLAATAADARCTLVADDATALAAAYLVDRGRAAAIRRRAEALGAACPEADVLVTGPWPPYSFSEAGRG